MATMDAWELYNEMFKDGNKVVIVTEDDELVWGELQTEKDGCFIHRPNLKGRLCRGKKYYWHQIRFMSNDGFPCSQLLGADGSKSIEYEDPADKLIREAFDREYEPRVTTVFGDPFIIEDVSAKLYNPGILDYDGDQEEVLVMTAKDGARGCLWDLSTIFYFA